ncbi:uncharacterized protein LOC124809867 [Hydra vulgaris]|uniref:uncharacterized protein LOC124809867 n=1 Tax=Hydra vulgaris TaxID=6087 RepID=UPI001F5EF7B0|nr:uncharacterized protein LOC124809867 isoform X2 [Hydra vulgaris]
MNYIVYLYCDSEALELKNCDIIMPEKLKTWSMDDWRSRGQTLTDDDLQIKAIHKDCVNAACILQVLVGIDTKSLVQKMQNFVLKKKFTPKNGLLKLIDRVGQNKRQSIPPLNHILTAESEVEIDFNTTKKKTKENSFKSTKQKEKKKCIFEQPPLPSLPLWEPPKLPDSDSAYILKFCPIQLFVRLCLNGSSR